MIRRLNIPKTIYWVAQLFCVYLLLFTLFRLATFFAFKPQSLSLLELFPSFLLGIWYDIRWISLALFPIVFLGLLFPKLTPFYSSFNKNLWTWYLAIVTFIIVFFFVADFGSFSYNATRLDAGAMNFAEDFKISLQMIWETYPLIWLLVGLVLVVLLFRWIFRKSHWNIINKLEGKGVQYRRGPFAVVLLLFCFFIYGKIGAKPLSWRDCFRFKDSFKSYLSLNPFQNFYSTLHLRQPEFNEQKAREAFPIMAEWLALPNKKAFNYSREVSPQNVIISGKPNVVLVLCESFSMYKSSMSGNPLNTTPFFDSLANNGLFFEKCFTPHFSTARGLFATITGIPDAQLFKFSTRNPLAANQNTIINSFKDYAKHYFLGGNPDFNNFKGLLKNIEDLQMHVEGGFQSPKVNVWGISDKDLFLEANQVFKKEEKPFFAIIQTSFNHRPYMIPAADTAEFKPLFVSDEELEKYGFEALDEFNSFRYSDFCFQKFMQAAAQEPYFENTLFVFVGDHGVAGNAREMYPKVWTDQRLTDEHVPLLFYAPGKIMPERKPQVVSQIDVLPTIAGMLDMTYLNTSLGRNLLDSSSYNHFAFITNTMGKIGIVTNDFYFTKNLNFPDESLKPMNDNPLSLTQQQLDSIQQTLSILTSSYYETSRYLIMNNGKK